MTTWITTHGGRLSSPACVEFDTPDPARTALERTVVTPLVHLGALDIQGPDTQRFLQGQTSAQLDLVNGQFAPLTAFCSAKGRVIANAQVLQVNAEHYRLILDRSLVEPLAQHLGRFAAFYKTELVPHPEVALIGIIGSESAALTEVDCDLNAPEVWHQASNDDAIALGYPGPQSRYLVMVSESHADALFERLLKQCVAVGNTIWKLADIQSGLHFITADQQDTWLPQMLNWEALAGISFKKGCYTGQEVVARAHFRGQVKKRLFRGQLEGSEPLPVGSAVINADDKRMGEIIACQLDAYGQTETLAVLSTSAEDMELSSEGRQFQTLKLPYTIERLDPENLASTNAGSDSAQTE
ncbi:YgfZ/GcvT domain-containing protein [Halomonas huangheensis]|uniref:Uncharacterized protein n=1 Tax=Halomonas huangheensis TaxID=1178482 RepID=W1NCZ8_9GAMM|nr:folate-binding protein YgfZ [Halomonas huangheensis]ALM52650.1 aminomethyltransferase [Halomonas huangheensis]ERL52830.1 hypothetical protein BJB45_16255 [Halomonas huangheensis]